MNWNGIPPVEAVAHTLKIGEAVFIGSFREPTESLGARWVVIGPGGGGASSVRVEDMQPSGFEYVAPLVVGEIPKWNGWPPGSSKYPAHLVKGPSGDIYEAFFSKSFVAAEFEWVVIMSRKSCVFLSPEMIGDIGFTYVSPIPAGEIKA